MKRFLDVTMALGGLVVLSPVLILVACLVRIRIGSPVLFRQMRPGLNGNGFALIKFRTMSNSTGPDGKLLPDAERLGRFGKTLRALSLDELPSLINIVRGEMSLVGPRPLLMKYLPLYDSTQYRRHEVRPGLTGWAQVNGRNALSWEDKFAYDVWYVDNRSLSLDLRILLLTVRKVLARENINASDTDTMPEFTGTAASALTEVGDDIEARSGPRTSP